MGRPPNDPREFEFIRKNGKNIFFVVHRHVAASCLSLAATFFVKSPPAQPGGVELKRSIEKRRNRRSGERREKGKQKEESEKKATMEMRRIEAMQRPSLLENPKG